jgi:serine phosphatase RsbU (regulator of sigma subunit)
MFLADEWRGTDKKTSEKYTSLYQQEAKKIENKAERAEYTIALAYAAGAKNDTVEYRKLLSTITDYVLTSNNDALKAKYHTCCGNYLRLNHVETDEEHARIKELFNKALKLGSKYDSEDIARTYYALTAFLYNERTDLDKFNAIIKEWALVVEKINQPRLRAKYYKQIAFFYRNSFGKPAETLKYNFKALDNYLLFKDSINIAEMMVKVGMGSYAYGDKQKNKNLILEGLHISERNVNLNPSQVYQNMSDAYRSLVNIYENEKNTLKEFDAFRQAIYYNNLGGNLRNEPLILGDMGVHYANHNILDTALILQKKALELRKKMGITEGVLFSYGTLASLSVKNKNYDTAIYYAKKSLEIANKTNRHSYDDNSLEAMYLAYQGLKDYENSYYYMGKYYAFKDSIRRARSEKDILDLLNKQKEDKLNEEFERKTALSNLEIERNKLLLDRNNKELLLLEQENDIKAYNLERSKTALHQHSLEIETSKKTIDVLNLDKKLKETEAKRKEESLRQQKTIIYSICSASILVLILLFFALRGYVQKKKDNLIITKQKNEVQEQKALIEEKQKEIIDSINYAKRIQNAILAPETDIKKYLPDSFLLYKPKDIVAGDFYFFEVSDNFVFYAAADCTGHGVPGALVSVVCSNALSRSIKEFNLSEPGEILDKSRELVLDTFRKSGQDVKDGMDISLISLPKTRKSNLVNIKWAGANNPLWYYKNGILNEIGPNKQPIGQIENPVPFTTHEIELNSKDTLFLFTDGLPDQFGGPKGKKFKYKQFKEIITTNLHLSTEEQKRALSKSFENWKGSLEQVDDVCVIGVRI